ncbi:MAG: FGGY-family carbohydrate kinase [Zavarzinella sp.]
MPIRSLAPDSIITGWDFSTGSVKCVAFDLQGNVVASCRFPTDLWTEDGVSEFNLMLLEGQVHTTVRAIVHQLNQLGRLSDWVAGGISATHHTSGRVDALGNQIRRMICWNDQTLAAYHAKGITRLGGEDAVRALLGGPWAIRYSLSHLVKDEETLTHADWQRTRWLVPHGCAALGYLTGNWGSISISTAASTGMMQLEQNEWCEPILNCIQDKNLRQFAWQSLPAIQHDMNLPVSALSPHVASAAGWQGDAKLPFVFPTLDDQAAGLVGGGAVEAGQVAVILGNSAVVNSSASAAPGTDALDAMKLNWGPWLWMRCYSNGAQFLDRIVGHHPDWQALEQAARKVPPGCEGIRVSPFVLTEPSLGIHEPRFGWSPSEPSDAGVRFRAALESLACLITLGVQAHQQAGQQIRQITVSGGIARSQLMLEILASMLNMPLLQLESDEGPALGAAVVALAGAESYQRTAQGITEPFTVQDAVAAIVKFKQPVAANPEWVSTYQQMARDFL